VTTARERAAPEPEQIYEEARAEGRRRLSRPLHELAATALVGGFDVAFGVAAYALAAGAVETQTTQQLAQLVGAVAFGIGFVFVVVGRSELFTENFLVPVAGLDRRSRGSWLKLGELWFGTFFLNLVGGAVLAIIMTSEGVMPASSHAAITRLAEHLGHYSASTALLSAVVARALMR
jgi:formate-nitrite transporter family protein